MDKIVVYRTHIEINNYDRWDCPIIEKIFSVFNKAYHRYEDKGLLYDTERRTLMLPRGLDVPYLESLFQVQAVYNTDVDPYYDIGKVMLRKTPRDDIQMQAINFMISNARNHTMMSLNLNTGKGKSYCAVATMAYFHLRTIIIADAVGWLEQWKNYILEYTDIQEDEIYFISGSPSISKLYHRDISRYKVFLCTHSTIQSVGSNQNWYKINEVFKMLQIGIKIFDEAHLDFDNMFAIDCYTNTLLTYYLTASPARSDWTENNIYGLYYKNVPSIDLYDRDRDAHTEYNAILFASNPTPMQISACKGKYGLDRMKYVDYLIGQENFCLMLNILIDKALSKPGKTLFYIGTNRNILIVRDWIFDNYPELIGMVGVYTSIMPTEQKKSELEKKIILSTTKSAGAAMDIKGLVDTINLAEPFKSRVLAQQTFGRTRDNNTSYKDIVDTSFYYTKKYYEHKKPVFAKYATKCREITLTDEELRRRALGITTQREQMTQPIIYNDPRNNLIEPIIFGDY